MERTRKEKEFRPARQGWGFAVFIVVLAASLYGFAWCMNRETYCDPTDVTCAAEAPSYGGGH
ncbi:MAG: hypothetical protein ACRENI_02035 [Gemmatimonadaceae bacterium]